MMDEMLENWTNGNRKDVVELLIHNNTLSDAVLFALSLPPEDRTIFIKMLQNRDK